MDDTFNSIVWTLITIGVFGGIAYVARDQYRLQRDRMIKRWDKKDNEPKSAAAAVSGIEFNGELSTSAKYAIWNYMFNILAVGGTVVGILAGLRGT
jgi:hypothetical protein